MADPRMALVSKFVCVFIASFGISAPSNSLLFFAESIVRDAQNVYFLSSQAPRFASDSPCRCTFLTFPKYYITSNYQIMSDIDQFADEVIDLIAEEDNADPTSTIFGARATQVTPAKAKILIWQNCS
ncbi:hypothetical protein V1504DRAFT_471857 [Lipomyces starkeyi]